MIEGFERYVEEKQKIYYEKKEKNLTGYEEEKQNKMSLNNENLKRKIIVRCEEENQNKISLDNDNLKEKIKNETPKSSTEYSSINDLFENLLKLQRFLAENCKDFNDKFEITELIKSGSAGAVYRGQIRHKLNKQNSKQIAFKFLFNNYKEKREKKTKDKSKKNKREKNQHLEISIHGMLKNKHIPEIYGYYKILDNSCIAMEFTKYGDIENFKRTVLKRSSLSETLILYIAGGILEALKYIHIKKKIIHMDIKQQNVLIDDFLVIKITDFSVSINYRNKDYIDLPMVGTCYYMSPEVLNRRRISAKDASKIDIYSLGVLLYMFAYADYPYNLNDVNCKDYAKIARNVEEKQLEFPKDTGHSKVFENFVKNCLNKDIKKRYDIYQAMKDPWFKGYQIILDEKEKLYNAGKFVIDLMVDNLISFNEYIKEQEK